KRSASQIVRSLRLDRSNLFEVVGRHFFNPRQWRRDAVEPQCLNCIYWLVIVEMICEWSIDQNIRARSVYAEERRLRASGANRDEARPLSTSFLAQHGRQVTHGRCLKQGRERQSLAETVFDLRKQANSQKRVSAQFEEIVVDSHGRDAQHLLANRDELRLDGILRFFKTGLQRRPGSVR